MIPFGGVKMEQGQAARKCPKCESGDYRFRSRKFLSPAEDGPTRAAETKYRCQPCGHEWKERTAGAAAGIVID